MWMHVFYQNEATWISAIFSLTYVRYFLKPQLYEQARDHLLDMNCADYFYLTGYPEYCGYRIEHDPTITAYCHLYTSELVPEDNTGSNGDGAAPSGGEFLVILVIILAIVAAVVFILGTQK